MILIGLTDLVDRVCNYIEAHFVRIDKLLTCLVGYAAAFYMSKYIPGTLESPAYIRTFVVSPAVSLATIPLIWALWVLLLRPIVHKFTYGWIR